MRICERRIKAQCLSVADSFACSVRKGCSRCARTENIAVRFCGVAVQLEATTAFTSSQVLITVVKKLTIKSKPHAGLEPATFGLEVQCAIHCANGAKSSVGLD